MSKITMEEITNFCKQYGYIFRGSEIYGGLANTWDYGPLGSKIKNNLKDTWRKKFIQKRKNAYEIDADILMHPKVWEASGHITSFNDPLIDCKECKSRYRADNLVNDYTNSSLGDNLSLDELNKYIKDNQIPCPKCQATNFTEIRKFSQMFETSRGVIDESKTKIYLRPENAQGEYVNYLNVKRSTRTNLPFSIGQIGKAFRNEITPGNFTFRTIEFEQMEYQTFCKEGEDEKLYNYFKGYAKKYFLDLGLDEEKLRFKDHEKLIFYAKAACDIEYLFPFGWGEINGTHNRTNYDLSKHQEYSKVSMEYLDPITNEKYIPYVIESTIGLDRLTLAIIINSYNKEELKNGTTREVMKLHPFIAPYKVAVLPLLKSKHSEKANEVFEMLSDYFSVSYDETGSIGKRYRRQDIMGTPFCLTIDDNTLENNTITLRNRDTMEQIVLELDEVVSYINERIIFK